MSVENFRTGNPDIHYSGYPGSEFPHQCGGGYGYGGYGQYGTYGSCATYDHYNANKIDFGGDGVSCGAPPMKPIVSDCNAPAPLKPATKCGPCGDGVEGFAGAGDDGCHLGCAKPAWWGDVGCQMPPKHCGAGSCGYYGADGGYKTHGQAGFETFDGAMTAYSPYAADAHSQGEVPVAGACDATFGAQHKPGCNCVKCMMPYSAPYHVGPGCGRPTCRCKQCDGDCKCGAVEEEMKLVAMAKARAMAMKDSAEDLLTPRNLIIALVVAYLAYRLFRR
jgi:hypothetical protein